MPIVHPSRRRFLQQIAAGAMAAGLPLQPSVFSAADQDIAGPLLGKEAAKKNILFGFALNYRMLTTDATYRDLVAREATIVVPENALKWEAVHPEPDRYTFEQADAIVDFAEKNSMKIRGHNFCWHRALPTWVTRDSAKDKAESMLREHIATVAGRYRGKMHSWDVVNEAIQLKDNQPNGFRKSFWYQSLGPAYVDIAFHAANAADPAAILAYNDYGLEYENATDSQKRRAVLALLHDLKRRGVPIGALGMQSHLRAGTKEQFAYDLPKFIAEVVDMGLQVYLTELDVDDSHVDGTGVARDEAVADTYKRYLDLVLGGGKVRVAITWGVWDRMGKVGAEASAGPASERPLLFALDGTAKIDTQVVSKCFQRAPVAH